MAVRPCSIAGCNGLTGVPGTARGWCSRHYQAWQRHGDPLGRPEYVNKGQPCAVEGCGKPAKERGWCSMHYTRWLRHGSLEHPEAWGRAPDGQRWCARCEGYKPTAAFYVNRSRADGLSTSCGTCDRQRVADYQSRNPEKVAEWAAQRYRRLGGRGIKGTDVADRDGWRCGICGKTIGRNLVWPDPRSLSIDHIVPLSRGGEHEMSNVQASHLRCNVSKKAGGTDQLRLIG
jgi:hypothetical protein